MRLQAVILSVVIAAPAAAQTTSLSLRVLADTDATPLRRAKVVALSDGRSAEPVFSGDDGRLQLTGVGPTTTLHVSKAGYAPRSLPYRAGVAETLEIRLALAAVITGRVIDSRGRPAVRVGVQVRRVDAAPGEEASTSARTDDRGEFRVGALAAGHLQIYVERGPGAGPAAPMQEPASDILGVTMGAGEQIDVQLATQTPSVEFPFSEGGVVTGTLRDEHGEPAEGVGVTLQAIAGSGVEATGPPATVDDTGRFRLFHVPPGRYLMVVTTGPGSGLAVAPGVVRRGVADLARQPFLPVYFPGHVDPSAAAPIVVERARELHGIDMVVPAVRGARVFGSVSLTGSTGPVLLRPARRSTATVLGIPSTTITADGTFELRNVPPGQYTLQFLSPAVYDRPSEVTDFRFAAVAVSVDAGDVGPVVLSPAPTSTIGGRIVLEGDRAGVMPRDFGLAVLPADAADSPDRNLVSGATMIVGSAEPDSRWTFRIAGLAGPVRLALARAPRGWWLKSARVGASDAAIEPADFGAPETSRDDVELVFAQSAGAVTGRAVGADGRPLDLYTVVAFPPDRDRWFEGSPYVTTTTSRSNGDFLLPSLPPGPYLVAAIEYSELDPGAEDILRPDALAELAATAQRLSVGERQQHRVDLRLVRTAR